MGLHPPCSKTSCPFWECESGKCSLCHSGLFIPLDDHINTYCTTSNYVRCLQFKLGREKSPENFAASQLPEGIWANRRQYSRYKTEQQITFVRLVKTGEVVQHISTPARTVDMSKGGMKLAVDTALEKLSTIHFTFAPPFSEHICDLPARVSWCAKPDGIDQYHIGLEFKDQKSLSAIDEFMRTILPEYFA